MHLIRLNSPRLLPGHSRLNHPLEQTDGSDLLMKQPLCPVSFNCYTFLHLYYTDRDTLFLSATETCNNYFSLVRIALVKMLAELCSR